MSPTVPGSLAHGRAQARPRRRSQSGWTGQIEVHVDQARDVEWAGWWRLWGGALGFAERGGPARFHKIRV